MKAQTKRQRVIQLLLLFVIAVAIVISGWIIPTAYADTGLLSSYDKSNAYDDLKNSVIGGNKFSLDDYPKDKNGTPSLISFTEYCYSTIAEKQAYFGLYVYIYNPTEKSIDTESVRNRILLNVRHIASWSNYQKYNLIFLNYSTDKACEKRFYKFRVDLSYDELNTLLRHDSSERVYEIVGIELSYNGNVTDYPCTQTYKYRGYSKGCNSNGDENDTLTCTVDGFDRCINLNVKHTEYRAKGDYYNGEQSQLNSVYFRVPNRFFDDYGELTEIACEWWQYLTKPLLVTNDARTVNAINSLYGRKTMELPTDNYYLFMVLWENIKTSYLGGSHGVFDWTSNRDYSNDHYNFDFLWQGNIDFRNDSEYKGFDGYAAAFYSQNLKEIDNTLTGDFALERLREHSKKLGGEQYRDRYSKALFEDVANSGYQRKSIKKDDKMQVFWNSIDFKNVWAKWFTGEIRVDTTYDELSAIITISNSDMSGSDIEISERLYINKNDVPAFKDEYEQAKKNDETLVLFRFSTTNYYSFPTAVARCGGSQINSGTSDGEILVNDCYYIVKDRAWNAYTVQEVVYLDFDIISLTYSFNGVETVIPVVASPIDIAGGLTPPLKDPLQDKTQRWRKIIRIILALIIAILIIWLLGKFGLLEPIGRGIVFVVTAPFKLLSNLFKNIKNKSNKK